MKRKRGLAGGGVVEEKDRERERGRGRRRQGEGENQRIHRLNLRNVSIFKKVLVL